MSAENATHTLREEKSSARYSKREGVTKIDLKYFFSSRAANARAKNVNIWLAFSVFTMCFSFTFFDLLFFEHILFSAIQFSFYFLFFVTGPARCGWSYVCQHTTPHHTTPHKQPSAKQIRKAAEGDWLFSGKARESKRGKVNVFTW